MSPPLGPTVRFPLLLESYLMVVLGLAGLVDVAKKSNEMNLGYVLTIDSKFSLLDSVVVFGWAEVGR